MSLLNDLYKDIRSDVNWTTSNGITTAVYENGTVTFKPDSSDGDWIVEVAISEYKSDTIKSIISKFISKFTPNKILVERGIDEHRSVFEYVFNVVGELFEYGVIQSENSLLLDSAVEFITEEPNSSLMYHRLFPNKRVNAELEAYGYKFRDGSGMKLSRKHFGQTNRNSGPSERRTMQSIIIFKDGRVFRKIAKQKWNQLVDTSDAESESWGVAFQRKIIADERRQRKEKGIEIHFK